MFMRIVCTAALQVTLTQFEHVFVGFVYFLNTSIKWPVIAVLGQILYPTLASYFQMGLIMSVALLWWMMSSK